MDIELKPGDIIVDVVTNDVGLLLKRYCLFETNDSYKLPPYRFDPSINLWAWEVYWVGGSSNDPELSRYQPYTESGLINLLKTGSFLLNGKALNNDE